ncbi:MAG: hypothetical protein P4L84_14370 [Isosphaeraceae bacterium]|nr:hypothetical protein [Isosphaeraceae bacterium]
MYVYATAAVILTVVVVGIFRKSFDPFAPHWLFLAGYLQVYVVQAISYRDYALRVRGSDLVAAANLRALWALLWFLLVYFSAVGRWLAARLPRPPKGWSTSAVSVVSPVLILWGLFCAGLMLRSGSQADDQSPEAALFGSFPVVMLVGSILILVTGRNRERSFGPITLTAIGLLICYVMIWMINGRRTPPLFGVLASVCAFYVTKGKRPSKPVLALTAVAGIFVVSFAIGFRGNHEYEHSLSGFVNFVTDFRVESVLKNLNVEMDQDQAGPPESISRETEEYGGFLLMMDTVPEKADYDYGLSYMRLISTYIPRIVWRDKPLFGREQWIAAWIAGSEFKRGPDFTGPAISLLGATQLNGGATATLIVLGILALLLRTGYEYFRRYESFPWVQAWWALTYYNSWLMIATDDPFVWFYYVYGHTVVPPMALFFLINRFAERRAPGTGEAAWGNGAWPVAHAG